MTRIEIANKLAETTDGNVWDKTDDDGNGVIRVYYKKGYAQIEDGGINIDKVGRACYDDVKAAAQKITNTYRG